ncbi:MAG: response regulator transcription factor [Patescibacteria group bacterium]
MRVTIVDDEKILAGNIAKKLEKHGFAVEVFNGYDHFVRGCSCDSQLYVVDVSLGDGSGFDIIKWLRDVKKSTTPIILISGYGDCQNVIYGLDIGADDYLTKPFQPDELVARIKAVIRRASSKRDGDSWFSFGKLSCCPTSSSAYFDGKPLPLTKNERLMLEALIERPNWTVPRDELINRVWGSGAFVTENTVSVTLSSVRKKIGPGYRIRAIYSQGFVLETA